MAIQTKSWPNLLTTYLNEMQDYMNFIEISLNQNINK